MNKKYKYLEWTNENIKKFWDYESQFNERFFTYRVGDILINSIHKYFFHINTVLDYGSGRGHLIKHLLKQNFKISALEFSDRAIKIINNKYKNVSCFDYAYTLKEIKKSKKKFDLVLLVEVIEHLNNNELDKTIENIKKLLSKNGIAVITTPNDEKLQESMVCCPECQKVFHRWQHVRSWNISSLKKYFQSKNFTIVDIFVIDLNYEKQKSKLSLKQKIINKLYEKNRKWTYKPHLICVIKK